MIYISLNGEWELVERPLTDDVSMYAEVAGAAATLTGHVPGDVNDDVFRSGRLPEPLTGLNFKPYAKLISKRSWWYRRTFVVSATTEAPFAELELDGLDVHADVWLNGHHLGHHATAFCPFTADVTTVLRRGKRNVLVVRLTTGRERVEQITTRGFPLLETVPTEAERGRPERGFPARVFLRKPAYTWGWDWAPALPTCGITGNCGLRFYGVNRISQVRLVPVLGRSNAMVYATVDVHRKNVTGTAWGRLELRTICEEGCIDNVVMHEVLIRSGMTRVDVALYIPRPRLWWPNKAGRQHRYTVEVTLECEGETIAYPPFRWGLRTVELDVRPGVFRFIINGRPIFIQGGNWVPCDHLYGRTTPGRVRQLVQEAAEANFNCLRVWGGGRYETDAFFDACDEKGILVWQDFMSACAPLPYDRPEFAELCRREALWQMRRLHNRACLILWCGNNEASACGERFPEAFDKRRDPAWPLYFEDLPRIAAAESAVPYWPTSPYGGGQTVTDPGVGDDHHAVATRPDSQFWSTPEYWDSRELSLFNTAFGYGGPCCLTSTCAYLGTQEPNLFQAAGLEHTNSIYDIPHVNFSITKHYGPPATDSIREYIRRGGLCQGLNLAYALESMRAHRHTWGGISATFNDVWGENGWSIIDYYLRRKISYYFVKRALAPVKCILRRGGRANFGGRTTEVMIILINSTRRLRRGTICFGYQSFDGTKCDYHTVSYRVEAFSREVLAAYPIPTDVQLQHGNVVAIEACSTLPSATWRHTPFRDIELPSTELAVTHVRAIHNDLLIHIQARHYAHAVSIDIPDDYHMSDCWFDLVAGEIRAIRIYNGANLPQPIRVSCENDRSFIDE